MNSTNDDIGKFDAIYLSFLGKLDFSETPILKEQKFFFMMYTKHNLSYFLILILFFCIVAAGKAQVLPFYNVTPLEDDDYFTKTVFSFNPAFMKSNKVKSILLQSEEKIGMKYIYSFNTDGMVVSMTSIRYNNEKPDTAFYTRYFYNLNGLIDKKARIDYSNGIVKVNSFQYNKNNKIDIIRTFTLNAQMPNRPQNNDWQGKQFPRADNMILEGALPDESLWKKITANNDFSSMQYRYYTENEFEAEERTEYFNFSKNSGGSDTCYQKKTYYYLKGHPVVLFLHIAVLSRKHHLNCINSKTDFWYSSLMHLLPLIPKQKSMSTTKTET